MSHPPIPIYRQGGHPQQAICTACEVRRSALFGALDEAALDRIHLHIADLAFDTGEPLYARGDRGGAVFTLRAGIVRFERSTEDGSRRIVRLAGRGDLIGQEALLQQAYADDVVACTPVQVCRIPRSLVDTLGEAESALLRELMQRWQRALDDAASWVAELAMGPARRRMLRLMLRLGDYIDEQGCIWMPRRDEMGAMLDLTPETASRLVTWMRQTGVIELRGSRLARLDAGALRRALEEQDAG